MEQNLLQENDSKKESVALEAGIYFLDASKDGEAIFIPVAKTQYPFGYKKGEIDTPSLNGGEIFSMFG